MQMTDMGHKMDTSNMAMPGGKESKEKMMYPSMHFDHHIPDELADKDVGEMCRLEVIAKVVSKNESDNGKSMSLEIHKMGYLGKAGKMSKEEYLNADEDKRRENDEEHEEEEKNKEE